MDNQFDYPWSSAYALAVRETDSSKVATHMESALNSIEERLRNPVDIAERVKIEDAKIALGALRMARAAH